MVRLTERALVGCPLWMVRGDGVPGVYHDQPVTTVGGHPHLVAVMFQAARQLVADVHRLGGVVHTHLGRVGTIEARHHPKAATAKNSSGLGFRALVTFTQCPASSWYSIWYAPVTIDPTVRTPIV